MNRPDAETDTAPPLSRRKHTWGVMVCLILILAGAVGLLAGIDNDPLRAWRIYLVNFLFFTGIGAGSILFVCTLNMTSAAWGRNVKRVAEALGMFLPVSLFLFLLMIPGLKHILPWVEHPYAPGWWLDLNFLVGRNLLGLFVLTFLGGYIVYLSLRSDFGFVLENGITARDLFQRYITRRWQGKETELARAKRRLVFLSPIYAIAYSLVLTVIGVDLIMSLTHGWYSTLIGAYYFVGCFYVSLAALMLAVIYTRKQFGLGTRILPNHLHDIAKLTMGFGIVTGDFFYTQLFVVWYGNLPEETTFLIARMNHPTWRIISILVLLFCFLFPLVAMLKQNLKRRSGPMMIFALVVLAAMWMERFLLIGPSLPLNTPRYFGMAEVLITLGFFGLLGLTFLIFIHRVPPVVLLDPVLDSAGKPTGEVVL